MTAPIVSCSGFRLTGIQSFILLVEYGDFAFRMMSRRRLDASGLAEILRMSFGWRQPSPPTLNKQCPTTRPQAYPDNPAAHRDGVPAPEKVTARKGITRVCGVVRVLLLQPMLQLDTQQIAELPGQGGGFDPALGAPIQHEKLGLRYERLPDLLGRAGPTAMEMPACPLPP